MTNRIRFVAFVHLNKRKCRIESKLTDWTQNVAFFAESSMDVKRIAEIQVILLQKSTLKFLCVRIFLTNTFTR